MFKCNGFNLKESLDHML